jgi:hypothetical protein
MSRLKDTHYLRRAAFGLAVPAALGLAVPAALAFAGNGPALAATGRPATGGTPACTDNWVGPNADGELWTNPQNWSTGEVPGPTSNACINTSGDDVLVNAPIQVGSLQVGSGEGVAFEGTSTSSVTAQVTGLLALTPGGANRIDMTDATLDAGQISDPGSIIFTAGTCTIDSPHLILGPDASLQALTGTTTLTHMSQLSHGTLTGPTIIAAANLVLPGNVTHLVSADLSIGQGATVTDPAGHPALAGLTSVDAASTLSEGSSLRMTGSLTAMGDVTFGDQPVSLVGNYTQAGGTLTLGGTNFSAGQVTVRHDATLTGEGATIAGNLVNNGTVIATGDNGEGQTSVTSNYTQGPGGDLTPGFGTPLAVADTATLAGKVSVFEFLGNPGGTTAAITFHTLSGNFTRHNLGVRLFTQTNEIEAILLPQISASPKTVAPGGQVTVDGGSFSFGSVSIYLDHVSGTPLATTSGGIEGTFSVPVTIPSATTAGLHKLIAVASGDVQASTAILVS